MTPRRWIVTRRVILGLLVPALAHAWIGPRNFERLPADVALSDLDVNAIAVGPSGYLWLGTEEGLNRYDGRSVRIFRRGTSGLDSNRISSLLLSRRGVLWVGTRGGGLSRYDAESQTFTTYRHDPEDAASLGHDDILDLAEDPFGRLWIATSRAGISRLDPTDLSDAVRFDRLQHDEAVVSSLSDDRTRALHFDSEGNLWVGTMGGINRAASGNLDSFVHYRHDPERPGSLNDDEVWSVLLDSSGTLWAGTWGGGLSRLPNAVDTPPDNAFFQAFQHEPENPTSITDNRVMELLEDGWGTLWVGTRNGLFELPAEERAADTPRFLRHLPDDGRERALPAGGIQDLVEDATGDLWIGTVFGVVRVDRRFEAFQVLEYDSTASTGLAGHPNDAVLDRHGRLWVGHTRGIDRVELPEDRYTEPRVTTFPAASTEEPGHLPIDHIHRILETSDGSLWFASYDGILVIPASETSATTPSWHHYLEGLGSNAVLSLLEDSEGDLWIGTYRSLHRAPHLGNGRLGPFRAYLHDPENPSTLSSRSVSELTEADDGRIWVGTYFGLNLLDPATGETTRFLPDATRDDTLSHENIAALWNQEREALWIGTLGGGLDRLDADRSTFSNLGTPSLASENIVTVAPGVDDTLWIALPRSLERLDLVSRTVDHFPPDLGFPSDGVISLTPTRTGLLLTTDRAVALLPAGSLRRPSGAPRVNLTDLRLLNRRVVPGDSPVLDRALDHTDAVELQHSDYLVAFEFAAVDFRHAAEIEYRYRLTGLDDDWILTGADDRKAVYSTLPHGSYRFEVQARYPNGDWPAESTSVGVRVHPPWWLTWWAKTAALLAVLTAAALWPLRRLRRAREQQQLLERKVAERTLDLEEANRRLAEAARVDFLTQLPNRRFFLERAEEQWIATQRTGRPFSLAIADVDDFKRVNDTWGHDAGDAVLVSLSEVLRETMRRRDLVARWGGEEFIFLFYDTPLEGALEATEKLRRRIEEQELSWRRNGETLDTSVTMTFGLVEVLGERSLKDATSLSDRALYRGKREGKNRVVVATDA